MSIHVSSIGRCLVLSFGAETEDQEFNSGKDELLRRVQQQQAEGVIFDFSAVIIMDQTEFERARRLARVTELLGARTLFAGFQPEVVNYLITANVDLSDVEIASGVDEGLARFGLAWKGQP